MCADTSGVTRGELDARLLVYQNQAMRTLGFAYQVLGDGDTPIADNNVTVGGLTFQIGRAHV